MVLTDPFLRPVSSAFQAHLHRFGISDVAVCECDECLTQDSWHVLLHCPLYAEKRSKLNVTSGGHGVLPTWWHLPGHSWISSVLRGLFSSKGNSINMCAVPRTPVASG
ncbi:Hypothetical protein CINCED_3A013325 [Cinara cedri]|uniref:Uncharacterized protein n=1 Tax=Cinara cedri TaxID=506608 RepID=A0A5E4M6H5_9HEMI|nr:Hypothetical protein CINCED_3A013325 [Cinara cedri]